MSLAADSVPQELAPYLNYGTLGLLVVAIFFGWVWAKPSVDRVLAAKDEAILRLVEERDRLITERDQAEEQAAAAVAIAQEKLVPLLVTFTSITQTLIPLLQEIVREERDDRRR